MAEAEGNPTMSVPVYLGALDRGERRVLADHLVPVITLARVKQLAG